MTRDYKCFCVFDWWYGCNIKCHSRPLSGLKKPSSSDPLEQVKVEEGEDSEEEEQCEKTAAKTHLTPFELEGLWNLLGKLESLPSSKKCVPAGIHNAPALMTHIKVQLTVTMVFVSILLQYCWFSTFIMIHGMHHVHCDCPLTSSSLWCSAGSSQRTC